MPGVALLIMDFFFFCHFFVPLLFHNYASAFKEGVGVNEMGLAAFGVWCVLWTQVSPVCPSPHPYHPLPKKIV